MKKLVLSKESIRILTEVEQRKVVAGGTAGCKPPAGEFPDYPPSPLLTLYPGDCPDGTDPWYP